MTFKLLGYYFTEIKYTQIANKNILHIIPPGYKKIKQIYFWLVDKIKTEIRDL